MTTHENLKVTGYSSDGFIGEYQKLIRQTVIPYQYGVLCDNMPNTEKSHVVKNFENAARALQGEDVDDGFYGMVFQDSDAAKWLEAVAYSLALHPDEKLSSAADELIEKIANAQDEDGYLNTYFTIKDRDKRWTNLLEGHELYCAGHMMEAACAYYEATGKRRLLDVMEKNAEHIYNHFITEKNEGVPGHPEIELALMKMYRVTGNKKWQILAEHFIDERGVDPHFYEKEAEKRNWSVWGNNPTSYDYQQSGKPVREQIDATGHAVRAVYLYTGMALLSAKNGDNELYEACKRLWSSITERRMYVTGGIGSTVLGEAFTTDYDLPPDTAYAETCASIGLMFFASAMLKNELNGKYADVMETAFYNTVLAGMQLDGKRFFYVNPLEAVPGISGESPTHRHDLIQRPEWYACACCPPNVARLIGSFGCYAYGENSDTAFCHMFADGKVKFDNGMELVCKTDYPYDMTVNYSIVHGGSLSVRIPGWSKEFTLLINGEKQQITPINGYIMLNVKDNAEIRIILDDTPKFVYPSVKIPSVSNMAAVRRGPLIYCFEQADNGDILSIALKRGGNIRVCEDTSDNDKRIVRLEVDAVREKDNGDLYSLVPPEFSDIKAIAVPYYTWANRGKNAMRVFMPLY